MKSKSKRIIKIGTIVIAISILLVTIICVTKGKIANYFIPISKAVDTKTSGTTQLIEGVSLVENGNVIAYRNKDYASSTEGELVEGELFTHLGTSKTFVPGKSYQEEIAVKNSGNLDEYIRILIYKYWLDGEESLDTTKSDEYIELIKNNHENWILDETNSNDSRIIYYYKKPLAVGETTPNVISKIQIAEQARSEVSFTSRTEGENTIITSSRNYQGYKAGIEIAIDTVIKRSIHTAADAIWSAWGRKVEVAEDGTLTLL